MLFVVLARLYKQEVQQNRFVVPVRLLFNLKKNMLYLEPALEIRLEVIYKASTGQCTLVSRGIRGNQTLVFVAGGTYMCSVVCSNKSFKARQRSCDGDA